MKFLREKKSAKKAAAIIPVDKKLYLRLTNLRLITANEQKVPAYAVFPNSTLTDMCMKLPATAEEFVNISGIGKIKAEKYGERFLNAIAEFLSENNIKRDEAQTETGKEFDASAIEISEDPITVSAVADRINCVLMESGREKISGQKMNAWLFSEGYIEIAEKGGKSEKIPSDTGLKLGITRENRVIRGETAKINFFAPAAQKYIAENALKI
jgi:ATP-dependent DNA helicase RecQ